MQFAILAVCGVLGFTLMPTTVSTNAVQTRSVFVKESAREKRWGKILYWNVVWLRTIILQKGWLDNISYSYNIRYTGILYLIIIRQMLQDSSGRWIKSDGAHWGMQQLYVTIDFIEIPSKKNPNVQ